MENFTYGNYDSTISDLAFDSSNGYVEPSSEQEVRKQLSYPLKEVKDFVNNTLRIKKSGTAVMLRINSNNQAEYSLDGETWELVIGTGGTGPGVPTGGSSNQALVKNSNDNYDTTWKTLDASDVGLTVSSTVSQGGTNLVTSGGIYTHVKDTDDATRSHISTVLGGNSILVMTQEQYDALEVKDSNTIYFIKE